MSRPRHSDHFTRRAKRSGYPARSIFKLEEIHRRFSLFRTGQKVLDLGAAPGSWSLFAAQQVGPSGRVTAVDIQPISQAFPSHVRVIQGDAFAFPLQTEATGDTPSQDNAQDVFDLVLSDMAPSTTGHRNTDQARSMGLATRAFEVAQRTLLPGGSFVVKLFDGPDVPELQQQLRKAFKTVKRTRPEATRNISSEFFWVATGFQSEP